MNRKTSNVLKKTIKVACFTCVTLGGAALIASGAALKGLTEGAKYLKNTVQKIISEDTVIDAEFAEAETATEEAAQEEAGAV